MCAYCLSCCKRYLNPTQMTQAHPFYPCLFLLLASFCSRPQFVDCTAVTFCARPPLTVCRLGFHSFRDWSLVSYFSIAVLNLPSLLSTPPVHGLSRFDYILPVYYCLCIFSYGRRLSHFFSACVLFFHFFLVSHSDPSASKAAFSVVLGPSAFTIPWAHLDWLTAIRSGHFLSASAFALITR